jgi:hypothetical protein
VVPGGRFRGILDNDGPCQQVPNAHTPLIAYCNQAFHAKHQRAQNPTRVGYEEQNIGSGKREVSDDRFSVGDWISGIFRRGHLKADKLFPDAPAIEQAVSDENVSSGGQKTDYIRQPGQTDDEQEIDKTCNSSRCTVCSQQGFSSV